MWLGASSLIDALIKLELNKQVKKWRSFQVLHTVDRHWVFCKTEHREGVVPTSHVTPQPIEDLDENQSIFMAQCNINGRPDLVVTKGEKPTWFDLELKITNKWRL